MATSAGNVAAVGGQVSWPAMIAAHATVPEAGGRDCTWAPISTWTAVRKGAAREAGDPGNDELTTTGYGHGNGEAGRRALAGLTAASACRTYAQGPSGCNCRAAGPSSANFPRPLRPIISAHVMRPRHKPADITGQAPSARRDGSKKARRPRATSARRGPRPRPGRPGPSGHYLQDRVSSSGLPSPDPPRLRG